MNAGAGVFQWPASILPADCNVCKSYIEHGLNYGRLDSLLPSPVDHQSKHAQTFILTTMSLCAESRVLPQVLAYALPVSLIALVYGLTHRAAQIASRIDPASLRYVDYHPKTLGYGKLKLDALRTLILAPLALILLTFIGIYRQMHSAYYSALLMDLDSLRVASQFLPRVVFEYFADAERREAAGRVFCALPRGVDEGIVVSSVLSSLICVGIVRNAVGVVVWVRRAQMHVAVEADAGAVHVDDEIVGSDSDICLSKTEVRCHIIQGEAYPCTAV
ncbi:hypothetical protein DFP72DRAFT_912940 [Ephemerocybe angulata]|uniref:Uncharacterized protein n=1 Tax=Ephemerocybe angulata TaxID=980116 RepID=A0A8H6HN77_9AGAR|nr:hypothetical protein DFP72DRAFT_912940 [Tulosesus angulatus]